MQEPNQTRVPSLSEKRDVAGQLISDVRYHDHPTNYHHLCIAHGVDPNSDFEQARPELVNRVIEAYDLYGWYQTAIWTYLRVAQFLSTLSSEHLQTIQRGLQVGASGVVGPQTVAQYVLFMHHGERSLKRLLGSLGLATQAPRR